MPPSIARALRPALLALCVVSALPLYAVTVTNTNDSGPGSLRQAILDVNSGLSTTIDFSIGSGHQVIQPLSAYPEFQWGAVIDGRTQPGYSGAPLIEIDGSLVSGGFFVANGLVLQGSVYALVVTNFAGTGLQVSNGSVRGCYIGVDATGTQAKPNAVGLKIGGSTTVGGTGPNEGNLIAGNRSHDLQVNNGPVSIQGNRFGTNAAMTATIGSPNEHISIEYVSYGTETDIGSLQPNTFGGAQVAIESFYSNNVIIANNYIGVSPAGKTLRVGWGVSIYQSNDTRVTGNHIENAYLGGVQVSGNSLRNMIFGNFMKNNAFGIHLGESFSGAFPTPNDPGDGDTGPNNKMNYPVLTHAKKTAVGTELTGTLSSNPNRTYLIEMYMSPACHGSGFGEGAFAIGSFEVTSDTSGTANFTRTLPALPSGYVLTATATYLLEGTSEFSRCAEVEGPGVFAMATSSTTALEGSTLQLTVKRNGGAIGAATVDWTASGPSSVEMQPASGTLSFADGEASKNLPIQFLDDTLYETPQNVVVSLSNPTGGTSVGTPAQTTITVFDNDSPPFVVADTINIQEGNSGSAADTPVVLKLSRAAATPLSYSWTMSYASAQPSDAEFRSGSVTFAAGQTEATVLLRIVGDRAKENDELFYLIVNGNFIPVVLLNDDAEGIVSVQQATVTETDNAQTLNVSVTSTAPLIGTVRYLLVDGTAKAGSDYVAASGFLNFDNESSKTIAVQIRGDDEPEAAEHFTVQITPWFGYMTLGTANAVVTILNDDAGMGPSSQWVPSGATGSILILHGAAPSVDTPIALHSSDPGSVSVPESVIARAGTNEVTFEARALVAGREATITATLPPALGGSTLSVIVRTYTEAQIGFRPAELSLAVGETMIVRASLTPASDAPVAIGLTATTNSIRIPPNFTIPPGGEGTFEVRGAAAGPAMIDVLLPATHGNKRVTLAGNVTTESTAPAIANVSPSTGPTAGGTAIEVSGARFSSDCIVLIGGSTAPSQQFVSASLMKAATPPHPAGTVAVAVACGAQTATLANAFTFISSAPSIQSVDPSFGSTAGGTHVTVQGMNFDSSCWVFFGGAPARSVDVDSATAMTAVVPQHAAGNVDVMLRCSEGDARGAGLYTFSTADDPSASISRVEPLIAAPGELVTIHGTRLRPRDRVRFGDAAADIVETHPGFHVVRVPDLAAGKVSINLIDANARLTTTGPIFTVIEAVPPRVTAVNPTSVPAGGEATLTGTGFRPGYSFVIGGKAARILALSYTQARVQLSRDTPAGSQPLEVFNAAGNLSSLGPAVNVLANGLMLADVTPACATTMGLVDVVIRGSGFKPGASVRVGDIAATNVNVVDATTLRARVPAGSAGLATIAVTSDGATATLTNAFRYDSPFNPNAGCAERGRAVRH